MIVGILSDSHGRTDAICSALAAFRARNVELVIHCGDIGDAETVPSFAGWNVHFVYGNCDWDRAGIRKAIDEIGATLHEPFGHLELDGKQIAWLHGDNAGLQCDVVRCGEYDYLFYGHTHVAEQHRAGHTLVLNPGALFRATPHTLAIVDLATMQAWHLPVANT